MKTRRANDSGEVVGLNWIDIPVAAFQVAAGPGATDVVLTLPAAAGVTDVPPALVVAAAGPPAVQGDIVTRVLCLTGGALDANLGIAQAWVSLAGGPGVGQITVRFVNPTAAAIPVAPAARTFRVFLDR
jgi:hypothetical protein